MNFPPDLVEKGKLALTRQGTVGYEGRRGTALLVLEGCGVDELVEALRTMVNWHERGDQEEPENYERFLADKRKAQAVRDRWLGQ